jgi:hypothetical protein
MLLSGCCGDGEREEGDGDGPGGRAQGLTGSTPKKTFLWASSTSVRAQAHPYSSSRLRRHFSTNDVNVVFGAAGHITY